MDRIIGTSLMTFINSYSETLDFENLIEQVTLSNEPIFIRGNNNQTAVLVSKKMWEEIQDHFDSMIANQRIDDLKNGKSEVYTLEEVMKKLDLDK